LSGEVGELCECFQWKGDIGENVDGRMDILNTELYIYIIFLIRLYGKEWPEDERLHLGEEMSDVLLYLVRLAGT